MNNSLPFRMTATAGFPSTPAQPEQALPPGWVRIPVSFEVSLPAGLMDQARRGDGAGDMAAGPHRNDAATAAGSAAAGRTVARPPALDGAQLRPGLPFGTAPDMRALFAAVPPRRPG